MQTHPFIFSNEPRYRLGRHLIFWLTWWIFQAFLYSFNAINSATAYLIRLPASIVESLVYLTVHIFLSYALMYFVIPTYLMKQRYWLSAIWVFVFFIAAAALSGVLSITVIPAFRERLLGLNYAGPPRTTSIQLFFSLMAGFRGALTIGGIAAAIKLMKYWYIKEQRNLQLQKENMESQLQLLKAQVHPHFLFNTLNNIYSFTQNTAPLASGLVMGLSGMLRYMLYECNQPLVPLTKEIKLLKDYCSLEAVRYDKHLDLQIVVTGDETELYIAPLLLLPFVENCFKHGASNLVDQAWISLLIAIEGSSMKMKLVNSKPETDARPGKKNNGIGIANVLTRLKLLYPDKHELVITNEAEVFIVKLLLELETQPDPSSEPVEIKKMPAHA